MEGTIKESMTNDQIVSALKRTGNTELSIEAWYALNGICGLKPDRHKAFKMIEKKLREGK